MVKYDLFLVKFVSNHCFKAKPSALSAFSAEEKTLFCVANFELHCRLVYTIHYTRTGLMH